MVVLIGMIVCDVDKCFFPRSTYDDALTKDKFKVKLSPDRVKLCIHDAQRGGDNCVRCARARDAYAIYLNFSANKMFANYTLHARLRAAFAIAWRRGVVPFVTVNRRHDCAVPHIYN